MQRRRLRKPSSERQVRAAELPGLLGGGSGGEAPCGAEMRYEIKLEGSLGTCRF